MEIYCDKIEISGRKEVHIDFIHDRWHISIKRIKQEVHHQYPLFSDGAMKRILGRIFHISGLLCIMILPIGYYGNNSDSTQFMLGAYGSTGQFTTVIRDCSGHALASEANSFSEASWSAHVIPRHGIPLIFGAHGGYYHINARYLIPLTSSDPYVASAAAGIEKWYFIPEISIETKPVGFGFGIILGTVPYDNSDLLQARNLFEVLPVSGHLRLGNPDVVYMLISLAEDSPILLNGQFNIGLGYRVSRNVHMYSGVSGLLYDRAGYLHKIFVRAGRHAELYGSLRVGGADGIFEGGASMGLIFLLGKRP